MKKFKVRYTKYACCIGFVNLDYTTVCVAYLLFSGVFNNYPSWLFLRKNRFHVIFETIKKIATSMKLRIIDIQIMMYWFCKVRVYFFSGVFNNYSSLDCLFVCTHILKIGSMLFSKQLQKLPQAWSSELKTFKAGSISFAKLEYTTVYCQCENQQRTEPASSIELVSFSRAVYGVRPLGRTP